jgi:hypothetical protein
MRSATALSAPAPSSTAFHPALPAAASGPARVFAIAYGRYLDGQLRAGALPDVTSTARAQAGPMIPPARRADPLTVQSVQQIPAGARFMIALRDRAHTFTASLTLAKVRGRWLLVSVSPPDLDTILAPTPRPIPEPEGSGPPERAARMFIAGYLAWLYGQAPVHAIRTAASRLLARFTGHPPRVPPTIRSLRPAVEAIAMARSGRGWQALANISDGHETYELVLTIAHTREQWLISNVSSPQ